MKLKSIVSASIGNLLEWYDFGLFAIYSPLFSRLFFPNENTHAALLLTFGMLAIGFLARPIGALLFGYLGDKYGRASTLRLSILMISIPTLLIAFIPTYNSIGIVAPLILLGIRIWQGLSLGGEYSGTLIYLTEMAPRYNRARYTSFAAMGANLGILLATLVSACCSYLFTDAFFESVGWRIPYLISGILSLTIFVTRLNMKETPVYLGLIKRKLVSTNPLRTVLNKDLFYVLRTIGLTCMGSTFYYLCFIYMPTFLMQHLHYSMTKATTLMTFFIGSMIIFVPLAGMICDIVGRRKMLLLNASIIALITIPCFYFMIDQKTIVVIFLLSLLTLISSSEQATTCVAVVENYPSKVRYSGLSIGYNISNGLFGGTAPLVCQWLIDKTHVLISPAIYIVICACITGLVTYFFVGETKGNSLLN
jgi:MHS family proline/betaine transporter-like MFS transporter